MSTVKVIKSVKQQPQTLEKISAAATAGIVSSSATLANSAVDSHASEDVARTAQLIKLVQNKEQTFERVKSTMEQAITHLDREQFKEANSLLQSAEDVIDFASSKGKPIDQNLLIPVLYNRACAYQGLWKLDKCNKYIDLVITHMETSLKKEQWPSNQSSFSNTVLERLSDKLKRQTFLVKCYLHAKAIETAKKAIKLLEEIFLSVAAICKDKLKQAEACGGGALSQKHFAQEEVMFSNLIPRTALSFLRSFESKDVFNENIGVHGSPMLQNARDSIYFWRTNPENNEKNMRQELNVPMRSVEGEPSEESRNIFGVQKNNDWINSFNIGSIMHMTSLSYDEFIAYDDIYFELSKRQLIEKKLFLSICFFTIATEIRFIEIDAQKQNQSNSSMSTTSTSSSSSNSNSTTSSANSSKMQSYDLSRKLAYQQSEIFHLKSIEIVCQAVTCYSPYITHLINSYHKHYNSSLDMIEEEGSIFSQQISHTEEQFAKILADTREYQRNDQTLSSSAIMTQQQSSNLFIKPNYRYNQYQQFQNQETITNSKSLPSESKSNNSTTYQVANSINDKPQSSQNFESKILRKSPQRAEPHQQTNPVEIPLTLSTGPALHSQTNELITTVKRPVSQHVSSNQNANIQGISSPSVTPAGGSGRNIIINNNNMINSNNNSNLLRKASPDDLNRKTQFSRTNVEEHNFTSGNLQQLPQQSHLGYHRNFTAGTSTPTQQWRQSPNLMKQTGATTQSAQMSKQINQAAAQQAGIPQELIGSFGGAAPQQQQQQQNSQSQHQTEMQSGSLGSSLTTSTYSQSSQQQQYAQSQQFVKGPVMMTFGSQNRSSNSPNSYSHFGSSSSNHSLHKSGSPTTSYKSPRQQQQQQQSSQQQQSNNEMPPLSELRQQFQEMNPKKYFLQQQQQLASQSPISSSNRQSNTQSSSGSSSQSTSGLISTLNATGQQQQHQQQQSQSSSSKSASNILLKSSSSVKSIQQSTLLLLNGAGKNSAAAATISGGSSAAVSQHFQLKQSANYSNYSSNNGSQSARLSHHSPTTQGYSNVSTSQSQLGIASTTTPQTGMSPSRQVANNLLQNNNNNNNNNIKQVNGNSSIKLLNSSGSGLTSQIKKAQQQQDAQNAVVKQHSFLQQFENDSANYSAPNSKEIARNSSRSNHESQSAGPTSANSHRLVPKLDFNAIASTNAANNGISGNTNLSKNDENNIHSYRFFSAREHSSSQTQTSSNGYPHKKGMVVQNYTHKMS